MKNFRILAISLLAMLSLSLMTLPSGSIQEQSRFSYEERRSLTVFVNGTIFSEGSWTARLDVEVSRVDTTLPILDLLVVRRNMDRSEWNYSQVPPPEPGTETRLNAQILNGSQSAFSTSYVVWTGTPLGTFSPIKGQDFEVQVGRQSYTFTSDGVGNSFDVLAIKSISTKTGQTITEEAVYDLSSGLLIAFTRTGTVELVSREGPARFVTVDSLKLIQTNVNSINPQGTIDPGNADLSRSQESIQLGGFDFILIGVVAFIIVLVIVILLILRGRRQPRSIRRESPLDDRDYPTRAPPSSLLSQHFSKNRSIHQGIGKATY